MKVQAPTSTHGFAHLLIPLLIVTFLMAGLAPYTAWAKKDMQIATEGDPGDGNLSPESLQAISGSGSSLGDGLSNYADGVTRSNWLLSWPGLPVLLPGQTTWFFIPRAVVDHSRWNGLPVSLPRERRSGHAR